MKKLVLILFLSISFVAGVFAQDNFENNPRIKELRKTFYTKELQLTDAESKAFWPLHKEMTKEQKLLKKQYKVNAKVELMPDDKAKEHLDNLFIYEQKKTELKKTYFDKFTKVLPVRKVAKIESTERKFKKEVLKRVRKNRNKVN